MKKPTNSGRLPAFQFYPADWRKDPGVQSLDYETRGIWFEMLCLMHESEERGVLLLNGQPIPDSALCRLLGLDNQNLTTAITTLLTYGVAHRREEDGAIYNRRMVKDEALRIIRKNAGSLGGNPVLVKQKSTSQVKQKSTPSSSSSSSISSSEEEEAASPEFDPATRSEVLASEGKYLEALSARIDLPADKITEAAASSPKGCLDAYLRNRAAENWTTRGNKPIGPFNWFADFERFRDAFTRNEGAATTKAKPKQEEPENWQPIYAQIDPHPVYYEGEYCAPDWDRLSPAERSEVLDRIKSVA
jgi:hypothetical protein